MNAAIIIDDWKLPIFEKHLNDAGFAMKKGVGPTTGTLTIIVEYEDQRRIQAVVQSAQNECARRKMQ